MFLVDFLGSSTFLWWQDLQWKWSLGGHFPSIRNTWIWQNPVCCFEGQNSDLLGLLDFFYGRPVSPFACTVLAKQSSWHRPSQRASHLATFVESAGYFLQITPFFLISRFLVSFIFPEEFGRACHRKVSLQRISVIGTVGWNMLEQIPIWPGVETAKRWCWSFPMAQMKLFASQALQVAPNIQIPAHIKFQGFWFQTWKKCEAFEVWVGEMMDCKNCNNCT